MRSQVSECMHSGVRRVGDVHTGHKAVWPSSALGAHDGSQLTHHAVELRRNRLPFANRWVAEEPNFDTGPSNHAENVTTNMSVRVLLDLVVWSVLSL